MTKWQKFINILVAFLMILFGLLLLLFGDAAYLFVIIALSFVLLGYSIRMLVYYFRMAKYMVGGKSILYRGILFLDLSFFIFTLSTIPNTYVLIYMVGMLAFSGAVDIMNAMDSRKLQGSWKLRIFRGAISVIGAFICLFMMNTPRTVVTIYCFMLFYNAVMRIVNAVRPTEVITIQ